MNGVWNAPLTGSGMTRLAPSSLAFAPAASTPSGEPAMTTWPGALKLATQTSSSARLQATSTWSSSRPRTAAIVPGLSMPASCMASARSTTRRTPSSKAAPRWPSARCTRRGCGRRSSRARRRGARPRRARRGWSTNVVSWALRVSFSSSASASRSRRPTSRSATSDASPTSSQLGWSAHGRPMPGRLRSLAGEGEGEHVVADPLRARRRRDGLVNLQGYAQLDPKRELPPGRRS